jgi:hypothetical protein
MSCQLEPKRAGSRAGRGAKNPTEARSIGWQAFYSLLLEPPVHASCPAAIGVELRPWRADFHLHLRTCSSTTTAWKTRLAMLIVAVP